MLSPHDNVYTNLEFTTSFIFLQPERMADDLQEAAAPCNGWNRLRPVDAGAVAGSWATTRRPPCLRGQRV
jgi:hypothetical protein